MPRIRVETRTKVSAPAWHFLVNHLRHFYMKVSGMICAGMTAASMHPASEQTSELAFEIMVIRDVPLHRCASSQSEVVMVR
jgi:hypothetical protein